MAYLIRWWLAAELIGLLALPLSFRIFRRLPDRGYAFSRVFGLLLVAYVLWIGGTTGLLPFSAGSVVLVVGGLGVAGVLLLARDRTEIAAWWRRSRRYVVVAEAVFLLAIVMIAFLRSYQPEIANTEKPFEFANYNAVNRSADFAPTNPWFSGKPMPYYYFGYAVMGSVAKLTGTPADYGFNVALTLTGGLAAIAVFGVAANAAVLLRSHGSVRDAWPLAAGLAGVALLLLIGNLEGVFEFAAAHGWNPQWVYQHLDVAGLQPRPSAHWYPDEPGFGSWWRATRLGSDWNFLEFPFFSFLLGDLHPHVLALPFKLLSAALALNLLTERSLPGPADPARPLGRWAWGGLLSWVGAALAVGSLIATHTWDYPPFLVLTGVAIVARSWADGERKILQPLASVAAFTALTLLLFVPFFLSTGRGGINGLQPTLVAFRDQNVNAEGSYLPFQHLLIFWLPLMLPAALFVVWSLARRGWQPLQQYGANALTVVVLLPLAWALSVLGLHGMSGLSDELRIRGWGWLTVVVLALLLSAALAALAGEFGDREDSGERAARLFLLGATAVALLLVYGPELFMVRDSSGTRANSTFKLWYSAWTLLSVVGGAGGLFAIWQWRPSISGAWLRPAFAGVTALVIAGALVYPLYASFNRTNGFSGGRTLNGLAFLQKSNPDEYNAAAWLNQNVPQVTTVLEAAGPSYGEPGRIASRTGLPTVIDWGFHQEQEGVPPVDVVARERDVRQVYTTVDTNEALGILAKYGVGYVVVGTPERQAYGEQGLPKFTAIGAAVFSSPTVTIFRIGPAPLVAAVP